MKRSKKLIMLLLAVLVIAMIPGTAFAKKKKSGGKAYVPTAGEYYYYNESENDWVPEGSFTASYKKDGRITEYTLLSKDGAVNEQYQYSWKKNYLSKVIYTDIYYSYSGAPSSKSVTTTTYKYKKKLPKTMTQTSEYTDFNEPSENDTDTYVTSYTWTKKSGIGRKTQKDSSHREVEGFDITKKKQLKGTFSDYDKISYYKNGNVKMIVTDQVSKDYQRTITKRFNKNGYLVSYDSYVKEIDDEDGERIYTTNKSYEYVGGKNFTEIICTETSDENWAAHPEWNYKSTNKYKIKVTGSMKVKKSRNCDRFGHNVWLGYEW